LALTTQSTSIKSDASNSTVITATVLDASNAVVSNASIGFAATGGQISSSTGLTANDGTATVTLIAGATKFNQVATVTATLLGVSPTVSAQIPVSITGTTISLISQTSNITDNGSATDTLTVTVKDAGNQPVYNAPVTLTQTAGTGSVSITQLSPNTSVSGTVQAIITGTTSGSVTLTATAAGTTATQTYTVSTTGTAFGITSPATDPFGLVANIPVNIVVNAPGVATVTFAASSGTWNGGGAKVVDVVPVAGVATASFSSTLAGIVSIQVFDKAAPAVLDTMNIAIAQPAASASQITVQSNTNVVAPSSGGLANIATLTATVRDLNGQIVAGAPVNFEIPRPSGGGEFISPVLVYTDVFGKAQTTFTSGSIGSGAQGIDVYASVVTPLIGPSITNIIVGGTAGSVVIGTGTKIFDVSPTEYRQPFSVQVIDSNGAGVANADVTLKVWPKFYSYGVWVPTGAGTKPTDCVPVRYKAGGAFNVPNEDINRNLTLDPLEDKTLLVSPPAVDVYGRVIYPVTYPAPFLTPANDAALTPASSSSGSLPSTVRTDANGIANFNLTFLKSYSAWVIAEITASTQVFGTESTAQIESRLGYSDPDAAGCFLPNSPFNEGAW
jgi:hypothetical protein